MQVDTLVTQNIAHADSCGRNIENNYVKWSSISAGVRRPAMVQKETEPDMLQRQRTKGAKGWETESEDRAKRATQTASERQATLQQKSTWKKGNEPSEERETRLQRMRDRLAAQNSEERDWRLQQTRTDQHAKLAVETRGEITYRIAGNIGDL